MAFTDIYLMSYFLFIRKDQLILSLESKSKKKKFYCFNCAPDTVSYILYKLSVEYKL